MRLKIEDYKKEQERMKKLNKLLEEDMLDLNNLEQQMIHTLENEGIP